MQNVFEIHRLDYTVSDVFDGQREIGVNGVELNGLIDAEMASSPVSAAKMGPYNGVQLLPCGSASLVDNDRKPFRAAVVTVVLQL